MLFVLSDGTGGAPPLELVQAMNRYNEELAKAGALLALDGLHPPSAATRLTFSGGSGPTVTDGPFTEAKEFVGGYWVIQARSQEEAVEWASRAPLERRHDRGAAHRRGVGLRPGDRGGQPAVLGASGADRRRVARRRRPARGSTPSGGSSPRA